MYQKSFYIEKNAGNNALSFEKRTHPLIPSLGRRGERTPRLFVPSLEKITDISEIQLREKNPEKITFQDFGFDGELETCYGLENFYEMPHPLTLAPRAGGGITRKMYLFDNHNHALYFWYKARSEGVIKDGSILYHIDEHADYRDPGEYLLKPESYDLEKVFEYTNFSKVNVGNYIIPAEKEGVVGKTVQIRSTDNLDNYVEAHFNVPLQLHKKQSIILNLDLDFFQPDLDFIDYDLKKQVVRDIASRADVITVATSPFFIDQKLALEVCKDLFYK